MSRASGPAASFRWGGATPLSKRTGHPPPETDRVFGPVERRYMDIDATGSVKPIVRGTSPEEGEPLYLDLE